MLFLTKFARKNRFWIKLAIIDYVLMNGFATVHNYVLCRLIFPWRIAAKRMILEFYLFHTYYI